MTAMENTHECSACGGTGRQILNRGRGRLVGETARLVKERSAIVEHVSAREWVITGRCQVCLGSGRISDVRTARDAMADAETLRQNDTRKVRHSWGAIPAAFELQMYPPLCADPEIAYMSASLHARAAFRAVPALRGEE